MERLPISAERIMKKVADQAEQKREGEMLAVNDYVAVESLF